MPEDRGVGPETRADDFAACRRHVDQRVGERPRQLVIRRHFVRRPAEHRRRASRETSGLRARARRESARTSSTRGRLRPRRAACAAPSAASRDPDSCSTRGRRRRATRAAIRCRSADAAAAPEVARSSASRRASTRPSRRIASRPSAGRLPCAALAATRPRPTRIPCARSRSQIGRLGDDRARRRASVSPARRRRCSSAPRRRPRRRRGGPAARPPLGDAPRRGDHRGDAGFHVLRAAAVQPAVALDRRERSGHAGDADGVGVAAEHQRAALARVPRARRRRSGRPGATSRTVTSRPKRAHLGGDAVGDLALRPARRARASG